MRVTISLSTFSLEHIRVAAHQAQTFQSETTSTIFLKGNIFFLKNRARPFALE
jgi:hypothetical protein